MMMMIMMMNDDDEIQECVLAMVIENWLYNRRKIYMGLYIQKKIIKKLRFFLRFYTQRQSKCCSLLLRSKGLLINTL